MKSFMKISMILCIIAGFFALAVSPAVASTALIESEASTVDAEITVFNPDGSTEVQTVSLSAELVDEIQERLLEDEGENILSILAEYGLIDSDLVEMNWQSAMEQRAESLGLGIFSKNKLRVGIPTLLSVFNKVSIVNIGGSSTRIGVTPALKVLELLTRMNLNRVDLLDTTWGLMSVVNTKGLLSQHTIIGPSYTIMVGFVGVGFKIPFLLNIFDGYSAATMTIGLGMHFKDRGIQISD